MLLYFNSFEKKTSYTKISSDIIDKRQRDDEEKSVERISSNKSNNSENEDKKDNGESTNLLDNTVNSFQMIASRTGEYTTE